MNPLIVQAMDEGGEHARLYLGDGIYLSVDDVGAVWIRTERLAENTRTMELGGMVAHLHEVCLDWTALDRFGDYVRKVHGLLGAGKPLPEEL